MYSIIINLGRFTESFAPKFSPKEQLQDSFPLLPYTSSICSMRNPWFYSLWVCFRLFVVLVSATAQLRVGCHSGKFILVVYKMNDLNLSLVTRTPKSFQIHFTSNCFNCFTAKVVSVFVFLSAGDTCLYAPILATCQSPPVASPCNQTQSQKCLHSRNTKKRNTWVGLLFTHHYDIPALGPGVSIQEKSELNKQTARRFNYTWHPKNILQNVLKKTQNSHM